jgi:hypothetical protein
VHVNDFVTSLIRTYVPIGVGAVLTWLATTLHVIVPDDASAGLTLFIGAVLTAVYYLLARAVEKAWPGLGKVLVGLGIGKAPQYPPTVPESVKAVRGY